MPGDGAPVSDKLPAHATFEELVSHLDDLIALIRNEGFWRFEMLLVAARDVAAKDPSRYSRQTFSSSAARMIALVEDGDPPEPSKG